MTRLKGWMGMWALVLGVTLGTPAWADQAAPAGGDDGLKEGQPALMFQAKVLNADAANAKVVDLQTLTSSGKKAVILSFFATYCEPCKKELPFLARMYEKYKDQGLSVVVVNIDTKPEEIAKVADLVKENGITYPIASDRFNIVAKRYGVKRLPCLYILDGAGKVSLASTGYTEEFGGQLLAAVQTRLGVPVDPNAVPHSGQAAGTPEKEAAQPEAADGQDEKADDKAGKKVKGKGKKKGK